MYIRIHPNAQVIQYYCSTQNEYHVPTHIHMIKSPTTVLLLLRRSGRFVRFFSESTARFPSLRSCSSSSSSSAVQPTTTLGEQLINIFSLSVCIYTRFCWLSLMTASIYPLAFLFLLCSQKTQVFIGLGFLPLPLWIYISIWKIYFFILYYVCIYANSFR